MTVPGNSQFQPLGVTTSHCCPHPQGQPRVSLSGGKLNNIHDTSVWERQGCSNHHLARQKFCECLKTQHKRLDKWDQGVFWNKASKSVLFLQHAIVLRPRVSSGARGSSLGWTNEQGSIKELSVTIRAKKTEKVPELSWPNVENKEKRDFIWYICMSFILNMECLRKVLTLIPKLAHSTSFNHF